MVNYSELSACSEKTEPFEDDLSTCALMTSLGRWVAKGGLYLPLRHRLQWCCVSISDRNTLNPQDKSRQSLAAVWYHSHPY